MAILVQKGDITKIACDAIVNPANSSGYMGGGVAGAIKRTGGSEIEKQAVNKAPIIVGKAVSTTAGTLPCKFVIHAPTMKYPAMRIDIENVELSTKAAFNHAVKLNIKTIAIPGMGTGVGGVSTYDAARVMVNIAKEYEQNFENIIFVGFDNELVEAFNKFL
jgi:O-acetyl-ADP-ribose deacetylase (regulator of RNase III)